MPPQDITSTDHVHTVLFQYVPSILPQIHGKHNHSVTTTRREFSGAIEDEAYLHAVCAVMASHQVRSLQELHASGSTHLSDHISLYIEEATLHLRLAIRLINHRMQDIKQSLSVLTIAAVARLAVAVAFVAGIDAHKAHQEGLLRLIELRGGINTFPRQEAHELSRIESSGAWMDGTKPRLPMYNSPSRTSQNLSVPLSWTSNLARFLSPPLLHAAVGMSHLCQVLDAHAQSNQALPALEVEFYEDTFAATQHALADFPHPVVSGDAILDAPLAQQNCWRCAAFVFFNTTIRSAPNRELLTLATSRLTPSLQYSNTESCWGAYSAIFLWVMFLTYRGSRDPSERQYFAACFHRAAQKMRLVTIHDARLVLSQQLWRSVLEPVLQEIWGLGG
jgi:hypothetical protein